MFYRALYPLAIRGTSTLTAKCHLRRKTVHGRMLDMAAVVHSSRGMVLFRLRVSFRTWPDEAALDFISGKAVDSRTASRLDLGRAHRLYLQAPPCLCMAPPPLWADEKGC